MANPSTLNTIASSQSAYFTDAGSPTTIVWGTDGIYSSYIVTSASESRRIEEIDIENGTGFEAVIVLLNKGLDVDITVIDDNAVTPPSIGATVTISSAFGSIPMLFLGEKANQARKREGERTFTFKSFNAISGLH